MTEEPQPLIEEKGKVPCTAPDEVASAAPATVTSAVPGWLRFLERLEYFALVAYAISLPLSISASEGILTFGVVLWVIVALAFKACKLKRVGKAPLSAPLNIPLLLFSLAVTLSGVFNGGGHEGQIGSHSFEEGWKCLVNMKTVVLPYLWCYAVLQRSKKCAVSSIVLLLYVAAVAGIWGSIQQVFNIHAGYKWLQGTGFHGHPMAYAGQMMLFSMICLGLFVSAGHKSVAQNCPHKDLKFLFSAFENSTFFVFLLLANFAGLFFAGEKSAWLGGFVGVLAVTMLKSWRLAWKALLGLTAISGLSFLLVPLVRTRIVTMLSPHDPSTTARMTIWNSCLQEYFPRSPIFGIGWQNFPHFAIADAIVPGISKSLNHAHSNYIMVLTTAGIVGLLSYFTLLIWIFKAALDKLKLFTSENDTFMLGITMGVFGAAAALASSGIFEFNFGTSQVRVAQWFLYAFL